MIDAYFAYGSNMNPARMQARAVPFVHAQAACLHGITLVFDKRSGQHGEMGHANVRYAPGATVHGVLYRLQVPAHIERLDVFERTPVNYGREVFELDTAAGRVPAWVYIANHGVLAPGLLPDREYLGHLLAGADLLPPDYLDRLRLQPCLTPPP